MTTLNDKAVIVGIGQTDFSKNSGRSELQLAAECVKAAIQDAGLEPRQIDGFTSFTLDSNDEIEVARSVGCGELSFFSKINYGGGAAVGIVHQAAMAVATGSADYVVGYRALNGRSGQRYSEGVSGDIVTSDLIHWGWYMPFGLLTRRQEPERLLLRAPHDPRGPPERPDDRGPAPALRLLPGDRRGLRLRRHHAGARARPEAARRHHPRSGPGLR
jgi:hypothetical protein